LRGIDQEELNGVIQTWMRRFQETTQGMQSMPNDK
jgi:hypothetical protein